MSDATQAHSDYLSPEGHVMWFALMLTATKLNF